MNLHFNVFTNSKSSGEHCVAISILKKLNSQPFNYNFRSPSFVLTSVCISAYVLHHIFFFLINS